MTSDAIRHAFDDAIARATAHHAANPDLESAAKEWLTTAMTKIIVRLQEELTLLRKNVHNPVALPAWALNPTSDLTFVSDKIPYALMKYNGDFVHYIESFLGELGLRASVENIDAATGSMLLGRINFFGSGDAVVKGGTLVMGQGGRVFEDGFVEGVVNGVQALVLTKK